ncbi:putative voltage-gated K channel beta subunit [Xylariaceae sp. FL0016]|nr:putative voltage-gated K channel beta subunit [Xylariaceae sp. FL0016]
MLYRPLGRSGLRVSVISLGGWLTYGGYVDDDTAFACMEAAYDCGINFFDCAENSMDGKSEEERNDLVISTKIYNGSAFSKSLVNNKGLSRKHIVEGMDGSLSRLGLDYVDIVYANRPTRHTPMEEIVRAFNHLIDQRKTLYWGTSKWDANEITQARHCADKLGLAGPIAERPCYNMLERKTVEHDYGHLFQMHRGLTVGCPLRGGLLTGKYRDSNPLNSRFERRDIDSVSDYLNRTDAALWSATVKRISMLEPIADHLGIKLGTLALAWALKHPNVTTAIMGASEPEQVRENVLAVAAIDRLTPKVMGEIDRILGNKPAAV